MLLMQSCSLLSCRSRCKSDLRFVPFNFFVAHVMEMLQAIDQVQYTVLKYTVLKENLRESTRMYSVARDGGMGQI